MRHKDKMASGKKIFRMNIVRLWQIEHEFSYYFLLLSWGV